jgi:hypothetical protein
MYLCITHRFGAEAAGMKDAGDWPRSGSIETCRRRDRSGWKPLYLTDRVGGDSYGIAGWKPTFRVAAVGSCPVVPPVTPSTAAAPAQSRSADT